MINITGAGKTFYSGRGATVALTPVDLAIAEGEFVSLIGPSGCGKSTLLNMIAGIIPVSGGGIVHDGYPVSGPSTATGYLTQQDSLLPWRTAAQNIAFAHHLTGSVERDLSRDMNLLAGRHHGDVRITGGFGQCGGADVADGHDASFSGE